MSKSANSNIFIPAIGGAALVLGGAFAAANIGYGNDRIETLQTSFEAEREAASSQAARVAELEANLAELTASSEEQLAAAQAEAATAASEAERQIAELRSQIEAMQTQASSTTPISEIEGPADETVTRVATTESVPDIDQSFGLGRPALDEEVAAWNVDVLPDGRGLPEGSGDVWTGDEVFGEKCASCHGDFAEGRDAWPVLAGGFDTLDKRDPVKTVGSYWPYLSTVWDYVHRSMPFGNAGTLTNDEVYAITAYILYSNDLVDDDFTLSRDTFLDVEMYNDDGFIVDDRPETEYTMWRQEPCMSDCRDAPAEITRRSTDVGVTPADDGSMAESVMELQLAELGGTEWGAERVAGSVFMDPDRMAEEEAEQAAAESGAPESAGTDDAEAVELAQTEETPDEEPAEEAAAEEASSEPDPELVAAGKSVFRQCQSCHQVGDGARNRSGPQLNGVIGRVAGSVDGFKYSNAFQQANADGLVWTEENLHEFLKDPKAYLKGTRMSFRGLKSQDDLDAITAYLASFPE